MADYQDVITRKGVDTDVIRVYPSASVEIYESGTSTLVDTVVADNNGVLIVSSLDTGHYDFKVGGVIVKTLHHVKADHTHNPSESFVFFHSGAITSDEDAVTTKPAFVSDVAGSITKVKVTAAYVDATGNVTMHLLQGTDSGASALTVSSDSVWNTAINPGSAYYRWQYVDDSPSLSVSADDVVQLGIDYTATSVQGVAVEIIFEPS